MSEDTDKLEPAVSEEPTVAEQTPVPEEPVVAESVAPAEEASDKAAMVVGEMPSTNAVTDAEATPSVEQKGVQTTETAELPVVPAIEESGAAATAAHITPEAPKPGPTGLRSPDGRGRRKVRQGRVLSNRMDKTAVVAIERLMRHPLYGKTIRRTKRYKAHDANNECALGDLVEIMETRPISREKRWRVVKVVEKAK